MYERRMQKLLTRRQFTKRVSLHLMTALTVVAIALAIGIFGYHHYEGLSLLDSLLNASMILGGMGPLDHPLHPAAKWFASFYALFCGLVFLTVASVIVAPFVHRLIHRFHIEEL
jgi:hypothetical protein